MRSPIFLCACWIVLTGCAGLKGTRNASEPAVSTVELQVMPTEETGVTFTGTLTDRATGDALLFGNIAIYREGELIHAAQTDFSGDYAFQLPPDSVVEGADYRVEFSYLGYHGAALVGLPVYAGNAYHVDAALLSQGNLITGPICYGYTIPVYQADNLTSGQTFTSDQIRRSPIRN